MNAAVDAFFRLTSISRRHLAKLATLSLVGGALNAGLVSVIGEALKPHPRPGLFSLLGMFCAGVIAYFVLQRYAQACVIRTVESGCAEIRQKVARAIEQAPLLRTEQIEHHVKHAALTRDSTTAAGALSIVIAQLTSAATVLFGLGYLFWLAPLGAIAVAALIALAMLVYQGALGGIIAQHAHAYGILDRFLRTIDDLLHGLKELKLDRRWARDFMRDDLSGTLHRAADALGTVRVAQHTVGLLTAVAFLALVGGAAFAMRLHGSFADEVAVNFVVMLLFLQIPIQNVAIGLPALGEATIAIDRIDDVLGRVGAPAGAPADELSSRSPQSWQLLQLCAVDFAYPALDGTEGFGLRQITLSVARGSTAFIVGGNGSGKTTLAKILMGLYRPTHGSIRLDDIPIGADNLSWYRHQFSAVFSDAHLFSRSIDGAIAGAGPSFRALLDELQVIPPVDADGRLDSRRLSQGQKKRLALAFALIDDKPICFFDEWTADQDPEFRVHFYQRFLPRLKAAGKTVFVISHDDRYFHHADLLIKLDAGRVREIVSPTAVVVDAAGGCIDCDAVDSGATAANGSVSQAAGRTPPVTTILLPTKSEPIA